MAHPVISWNKSPENNAKMEHLPENVLLHIFSCLDKMTLSLSVRLVCKQWCRIQEDPALWKRFTAPRHFTDERMKLFMEQKGHSLEVLDCNKCEALSETFFLEIDPYEVKYPNMMRVILPLPVCYVRATNEEAVSDEEEEKCARSMVAYMKHMSALFPNLQEIDNIKTNMRHTVDILECQSYFPNLTVIHDKPISSYGRLGHMSLTLNAKKKELWIENLTNLSNKCPHVECYKCIRGMHYVDDEGVTQIAELFQGLTRLDLHMTSLSDTAITPFIAANNPTKINSLYLNSPGTIGVKGFQTLIGHCRQLKKLALIKCPSINNSGMIQISSNLTELILDNSPSIVVSKNLGYEPEQITDDCIQEIAKQCSGLRMIRISKSSAMTSQGIKSLCIHCRALTRVSIGFCDNVTDDIFGPLLELKHLKRITLQKVRVTPKGIVNLVLLAPALLHLTLYHYGSEFYTDVSDLMEETYACLDTDANKYRPNVLQSLSVRGVGGSFLWLLTVLCPDLSYLDLCDDTTLTPFHFNSILKHCENLTKIDISSNRIVLDNSCLQAIADHGKNLRKLAFGTSLQSIDCACFRDILRECHQLKMIWIFKAQSKCDCVQEEVLEELIKQQRGHCYVLRNSDQASWAPGVDSVSFHFMPSIYLRPEAV